MAVDETTTAWIVLAAFLIFCVYTDWTATRRFRPMQEMRSSQNDKAAREIRESAQIASSALAAITKEYLLDKENRYTTDEAKSNREWLTLVVVAIYTIITAFLWVAQRQANEINARNLVEANRAWVGIYRADHGVIIARQPMYVQLTVVNTGREPALRGNWGFRIYATKYIPEGSDNINSNSDLSRNEACDGVSLFSAEGGITIWPTLFHTPDPGNANDPKLGAAEIPYTSESGMQSDIDAAVARRRSLILDACFVYWSGNQQRKTAARFLLRDHDGQSPSSWGFNAIASGNSAE